MTTKKPVGSDLYPASDTLVRAAALDEVINTKTRRVLLRLAFHRHPCERLPDPEQITTCNHPDHARDVEAARDAMDAAGVLPQRPQTAVEDPTGRHRGCCPNCGAVRALTPAGVLARHKRSRGMDQCPGAGRPPKAEQAEAS